MRVPGLRPSCSPLTRSALRRCGVQTAEAGSEVFSCHGPKPKPIDLVRQNGNAREQERENFDKTSKTKREAVYLGLVVALVVGAGSVWAWIIVHFMALAHQVSSVIIENPIGFQR